MKSQADSSPDPYKTSDTPYAAYLHYKGCKLVTTRQDPNDYKREVFVFIYQDDIPALEQEFRTGDPQVNAKKYYKSYRIVSRYVQEARRSRE